MEQIKFKANRMSSKQDDIYADLYAYISKCPVINTHSHHFSDRQYRDVNLEYILSNCYAVWMSPPPARDIDSIKEYILANRCNSYFRWLFAGMEALYGLEFNSENFMETDRRLSQANKDLSYHLSVLKDACGYERVLLDKYDNPGSDNGHPEIFSPVYRINKYFFGYDRKSRDHNGNNPFDDPAYENVSTMGDYISAMREDVRKAKGRGAVALKNATAYDRNLIYGNPSEEHAGRTFGNPDATRAEIKDFQDYIMYELVRAAEETGLPLQIHTGLGILDDTRPIGLRKIISEFPKVKFDIFHAGFPWTGDTLGLLHNYANTYVNICWLPLISTHEAAGFLVKALEISSAKRICWGCDTWTSEESLGALLAARHVLSEAMTEMVADGAFDIEYARWAARRILYDNPKELYGL